MHGELTTMTSAADACREVAASGATGVLQVAHPRGSGRVVFERGRVVSARSPAPRARVGDRLVTAGLLAEDTLTNVLRDQADLRSGDRPRLGRLLVDAGLVTPDAVRLVIQEQVIDAVFELTTWEDGSYEFVSDSPHDTPEVPLSVAVDQLLVEVARRRREWEALSTVIPDLGAVPRFREGSNGSTAALEPDEFAVLASLDGHRSIREIADRLGYGEFEAARVVYALLLLGLVEVDRPVDEIGAALDDALFDEPPRDEVESGPGLEGAVAAPADAGPDLGDELAEDDFPDRWAVEHEGRIFPAAPEVGPTPKDAPEPATLEDASVPAEPEDEPDRGLSAFAELRAFTTDEAATPPAPAPGPEPDAQAAAAEDEADRAKPDPPRAPRSRPAAPPSGDVSEFLRELSRLALDDADDDRGAAPPDRRDTVTPPAQPPTRSARPTSAREEPPKKKRRLFGRGG
jgi:hypothetical protein